MTSGSVNDFVSSLVEMAKAKELVPQLEEDIRALVKETDSKTIHIQELELNIIGYKRAIEELQSNLRTVEAARDDAEYRFLESEERQHAVLASVHSAQADLAVILAKIDPPKPEPDIVPQPTYAEMREPIAGNGNGDPSAPAPSAPAFATTEYDPYQPVEVKTSTDADQDQGEAIPMPAPADQTIGGQENASPSSDPMPDDPYLVEPAKYTRAWYHWADEMDNRYGVAGWPIKRSA